MTPLLPTTPVAPAECPVLSPERQYLFDAAGLMEKHGKNGLGGSPYGPHICAVVAIARAIGHDHPDPWPIRERCWRMLESRIGTNDLTGWSDRSDQQTVIQALRDAAVSA